MLLVLVTAGQWSEIEREREVVGSPRDRVGLDALEPAC